MEMTHHAVLLRSSDAVEMTPVAATSEVEVIDRYYEQFGINEARSLIQQATQRPVTAATQQLVVRLEQVTVEAQHALLKVLEEPPQSTRFTFVVSHDLVLLPTLLSRFHQVEREDSSGQVEETVFTQFLQADYKTRLMQIEQAAKKQDRPWQQAIRRGLLRYVSREARTSTQYAELVFVAEWLLARGAANKMLLEHAALHLPLPTASVGSR